MAGFMDILGTMVQQGMSGSSNDRMKSALGSGGSLNDLLGGLTQMMGGGQGGGTQSAGAGALGDMLGGVLGNLGKNKAALGGLAALAGAMLGGGRGARRGAVGGGGLAMLASLAFQALRKAGQNPSPPRALLEPQTNQEQAQLEDDASIIVKAMINAAKADGKIDDAEVQRIIGKLEKGGLTEEEKQFFVSEARKPLDLESVIRSAGNEPEMAAEIYAASLLAIEVDTKAERAYMQQLAQGLGLPDQAASYIESALGVQRI